MPNPNINEIAREWLKELTGKTICWDAESAVLGFASYLSSRYALVPKEEVKECCEKCVDMKKLNKYPIYDWSICCRNTSCSCHNPRPPKPKDEVKNAPEKTVAEIVYHDMLLKEEVKDFYGPSLATDGLKRCMDKSKPQEPVKECRHLKLLSGECPNCADRPQEPVKECNAPGSYGLCNLPEGHSGSHKVGAVESNKNAPVKCEHKRIKVHCQDCGVRLENCLCGEFHRPDVVESVTTTQPEVKTHIELCKHEYVSYGTKDIYENKYMGSSYFTGAKWALVKTKTIATDFRCKFCLEPKK